MDADLARRSTDELRELFRAAACPALPDVTGRLRAELVGPALVRVVAPIAFRMTGLGDWWGKDLHPAADGTTLTGHNLAGARGERTTLGLRAAIGPSRSDGRPAVLVGYPEEARLPWRRVVDELRLLPDGTLLGLTFGLPLTSRQGAPFLLHPEIAR